MLCALLCTLSCLPRVQLIQSTVSHSGGRPFSQSRANDRVGATLRGFARGFGLYGTDTGAEVIVAGVLEGKVKRIGINAGR